MKKTICRHLYFQVMVGILIGISVGYFFPQFGEHLKFLGDIFIKLVRMLISPIIAMTVILGISKMGDLKSVGRVGAKALIYFEVLSTIALFVGILVIDLMKPGAGMNIDPAQLDTTSIQSYTTGAKSLSTFDFVMNIFPSNIFSAFVHDEILQILFFSILAGAALTSMGKRADPINDLLERILEGFFVGVRMIMRVAPIAAFGAMAFTIGKFGTHTLFSLGSLIFSVYLACILFVFVILGAVAYLNSFSLWKLLKYIKEEIFIVIGTSSSESALPTLMQKMEKAGCSKEVVGLVVPTGYTFNLDGTSIYLTAAALFIAQATNTQLSLEQQISTLFVLMLTSKGAATVTGGGFITLAATLASLKTIPVEGMVILIGIDRFMSEARAITNLIGNAVATITIGRWEQKFKPKFLDKADC